MNQQQVIFVLGLVIILLFLIDAYRRSQRKRQRRESEAAAVAETARQRSHQGAADTENASAATDEAYQESDAVSAPDESVVQIYEGSGEQAASDWDNTAALAEDQDATIAEEGREPSASAQDYGGETSEHPDTAQQAEQEKEQSELESMSWEEALKYQSRKRIREMRRQSQAAEETKEHEPAAPQGSVPPRRGADEPHSANEYPSLAQGIVALHIMAPRGYIFYGDDLVAVFNHFNLHYNESLQVFQDYTNEGEVLFTITTSVKPGTFDMEHIDELTTPGISVFMDIHQVSNPKEGFKHMLTVLYKMSEHLQGTLLNELRQRFTQSDVSRISVSIKQLMARRSQ